MITRLENRAILFLVVLISSIAFFGGSKNSEPFWSESKYTKQERDKAIQRGMQFIFQLSQDAKAYAEDGEEFLWCFQVLATTMVVPENREIAQKHALRLAKRWIRENPALPENADVDTVWTLASTLVVVEELGLRHDFLRWELEQAAEKYTAIEWLGFDPKNEPPPTIPVLNKGRYVDVDLFGDAIIAAYFGDRFGKPLGATLEELMRWLPSLYPYATLEQVGEDVYYDLIYLVTHIVYAQNHYGLFKLDIIDFPNEVEFLLKTFQDPIKDGDLETYAEYVDSLKSFGISPENNADMAFALEEIMAQQNPDGSWGDIEDVTTYDRYHTTFNAIEALRERRFTDKPDF